MLSKEKQALKMSEQGRCRMQRASLYGVWFLAAAGNVQAATWIHLASGLTFSAVSTL